jgi:hypothetical protein
MHACGYYILHSGQLRFKGDALLSREHLVQQFAIIDTIVAHISLYFVYLVVH